MQTLNQDDKEIYIRLVAQISLIDGKLDSLMDATSQILANQENKDFKEVAKQMSKRASDYAKETLYRFLKQME